MIVKKIKKCTDLMDIDVTSYSFSIYVETEYSNLVYLLGEPSLKSPVPDEKELLNYAYRNNIIEECFWVIITEDGSEILIDGEVKDKDLSTFCLYSNTKEYITDLEQIICSKRWPALDNIRVKSFFPNRSKSRV